MGVFQNNLMGAAAAAASAGGGGFYSHQIAHSLRNSAAQNGTLKRTAGTPTSRNKFTMSYWVKKYNTSGGSSDNLVFTSGTGGGSYMFWGFSTAYFDLQTTGGNWSTGYLKSTAMYRDTSAWYHHVLTFDSTQSTQADRLKIYVNGERITSFIDESVTSGIGASEDFSYINQSGVVQAFGGLSGSGHGTEGADNQMAEIVFNDGQAYGPDSYGETKNGVWIPKDPSGLTFGNNGYYLNFAASGDLGNDVSGNNNDFTPANLSAHDQMLDSPTFGSEGSANFPAFSPLYYTQSTNITDGNLDFRSTGNIEGGLTTAVIPAGEATVYYFESAVTPASGGHEVYWGVNGLNIDMSGSSERGGRDEATCWAILLQPSGYQYVQAGSFDGRSEVSLTISTGDIIGMVIDRANTTIKWYINNVLKVTSTNLIATGDLAVWSGKGGGTTDCGIILNAGQDGTFCGTKTAQGNADSNGFGNFFYTPPLGVAYCTGNLPTVDAIDPAQTDEFYPQKLFDAQLWTGNGSSGRAITISGAKKPSLSVIKQRNATNSWNVWTQGNNNGDYDSFGEFNSTAAWYQNQGASGPYTADPTASALTLSAYGQVNASSQTYVNYRWVANGGTTSTNTAGDIDSTVEVDPSGGFSVVQYTGTLSSSGVQTVGHGLSKAPSMFISKSLTTTGNWWVFSDGQTSWNYGLNLQGTGASVDKSGNGSMSAPTSTVFSTNYTDGLNETNKAMIAFCFADIEGYIKSGSFVGNGNTNGPFVYTGFRPSLVIRRRFDGSGSWITKDDVRNPTNDGSIEVLSLNQNSAENAQTETADGVDFLSNGFKLKATNNGSNGNGLDYIYLALSFNPFKYSTAF